MLGYSEQGLENPVTIQDKLRWLNIYDADPLKSNCADKLKVKEYAKKITGVDLGVPTIAVWDKVEDIDFDKLPDKFVLKCNHGSGMNIIVRDKSQINEQDVRNRLNAWMNDDFAFRNGFESHYHWIERKIFAERLLGDGTGNLKDYKFWCFNGAPKIWTINDGNGHGDIMYYHMDGSEWNPYQVKSHDDYVKPDTFDVMVDYSQKLSKNFKFVRVDFYEIDGRPMLGEMTFTPGAFVFKYKKREDEIYAGSLLEL
jgi:hypothetical protein